MSKNKLMAPGKKLLQKVIYIVTWGGAAAATGVLATSGWRLSLLSWALACIILTGGTFASTVILQRNWQNAANSILGIIAGAVCGAVLGELVHITESYYPAVFTTALGLAALISSTLAVTSKQLTSTALARFSLNLALVLTLIYTGVSFTTGGLASFPSIQPIFGAVLGLWATLLAVAVLEG